MIIESVNGISEINEDNNENMSLNIVAIGGGSGLSVLLRGLKQVTKNITAIVTVADDGGGSGVLREDLGMLPPGDIRNCIVALANREPLIMDLMNYRFTDGMLKGQNFGNLMLAAMVGVSSSFEEAVSRINDIFAVTGKVLPVSTEDISLKALLEDGSEVFGESKIPAVVMQKGKRIRRVSLLPERPKALPEAIKAIQEADLILMGPGSLYTSIMPNLLVDGIVEAITESAAIKVYIANLMSQPGETDGYTLRDYYKAILDHTQPGIVSHILVNNHPIPFRMSQRYKKENAFAVIATEEDMAYFKACGVNIVLDDFTEFVKGYVRHDALKVAKCTMALLDAKIYRR